jgi:MFS transporter, UMF1 family
MAELTATTAAAASALRRQRRGWYLYGFASQTFPTVVTTVFMSRYLTSVAENAVGKQGRVRPFGIPVAPGSLFAYTVSAATVVLVVLMPLVGAVADRTGRKRDIMLGTGWFGALACVAMVFVGHTAWALGAALYALAFLGYSCSIVVSHSLLVDLSTASERDRVSSVGWALAYIGGGALLAICFATSLFVDKATLARSALCASGAWWLLWSMPVRRRLPRIIGRGARTGGGRLLGAGFRQLAATMRHLRGFPLTLAFLVAFLVYNDGIQTVATVAAQYGDKQLHLSDTVLLVAILIVQFVAFAGAIWLGQRGPRPPLAAGRDFDPVKVAGAVHPRPIRGQSRAGPSRRGAPPGPSRHLPGPFRPPPGSARGRAIARRSHRRCR